MLFFLQKADYEHLLNAFLDKDLLLFGQFTLNVIFT